MFFDRKRIFFLFEIYLSYVFKYNTQLKKNRTFYKKR